MNRADAAAVRTVGRAAWVIGKAVDLVVRALSRGGRVQAVIAGGSGRSVCSAESAADDAAEGARQIRRRARPGDVVDGIAARADGMKRLASRLTWVAYGKRPHKIPTWI